MRVKASANFQTCQKPGFEGGHAPDMCLNYFLCCFSACIFDIEQKVALKGLKFVNLNLPPDSKLRIKSNSNNIENMISETLQEFNATELQVQDVLQLYEHVKHKSSLLNRSRPQSVACGLIRYYILKTNPDYSIEYFREKIKLSELTITRIVKEIESIMNQ